jgi:hypothetical protein
MAKSLHKQVGSHMGANLVLKMSSAIRRGLTSATTGRTLHRDEALAGRLDGAAVEGFFAFTEHPLTGSLRGGSPRAARRPTGPPWRAPGAAGAPGALPPVKLALAALSFSEALSGQTVQPSVSRHGAPPYAERCSARARGAQRGTASGGVPRRCRLYRDETHEAAVHEVSGPAQCGHTERGLDAPPDSPGGTP